LSYGVGRVELCGGEAVDELGAVTYLTISTVFGPLLWIKTLASTEATIRTNSDVTTKTEVASVTLSTLQNGCSLI